MRNILWGAALLGLGAASADAQAQNFEPAGVEHGARIAIDRSVTFRRDDGLVQSVFLEVPRGRSNGVRYALVAADFDCERGHRRLTSRTEFSSRRDPVQTVFDRSDPRMTDSGAAIAEQLRVVCELRARSGSVSLRGFIEQP